MPENSMLVALPGVWMQGAGPSMRPLPEAMYAAALMVCTCGGVKPSELYSQSLSCDCKSDGSNDFRTKIVVKIIRNAVWKLYILSN